MNQSVQCYMIDGLLSLMVSHRCTHETTILLNK